MPRAKAHDSESISIDLKKPRIIYRPGDTLDGQVLLHPTKNKQHISRVRVCLYGRAKVKIIQHHGESHSIYRSRAGLFYREQILDINLLHHSSTQYPLTFYFTLPHVGDGDLQQDQKFKVKGLFRGSENNELLPPLPPPTIYYHGILGRQTFGYVEYVLAAYIDDTPAAPRKLRSPKGQYSTRVINFKPYTKPNILADHKMVTHSQELTIERSSLFSIGRKGQSPFKFNVEVRFPTTMQVNHPDPIPFYLSVTVDPCQASMYTTHNEKDLVKEIQSNGKDRITTKSISSSATSPNAPQLYLDTFKLTLHATTIVRAPTGFGDARDCKTSSIELVDPTAHSHLTPLLLTPTSSLITPTTSKPRSPSKSDFTNCLTPPNPSLNLGQLFNSRLPNPAILSKHIQESPLCPSFATYNIVRDYRLSWSLVFTVQDKFTPPIRSRSRADSVLYSSDDLRPVRKDGSGPSTGLAGTGLFGVDEGVAVAIKGRLEGEKVNVDQKGGVRVLVVPGVDAESDELVRAGGDVDEDQDVDVEDEEDGLIYEDEKERLRLRYSSDTKNSSSLSTSTSNQQTAGEAPEINNIPNTTDIGRRGSRLSFWRTSTNVVSDTSVHPDMRKNETKRKSKAEQAVEDQRQGDYAQMPPYRAEDDWDGVNDHNRDNAGSETHRKGDALPPPPYEP